MKTSKGHQTAALLERIGRLLSSEAHTETLLPVHWEALRYLQRANRFSKTAAALTAYLGLTKGTVSQTLKALQAKSLVSKQVNAKDRRSNHLALTSKGQKLLQSDPLAELERAVSRLDGAQIDEIETGLQKILSYRLKTQQRHPFGQCYKCVYFTQRHANGQPHYCQLLKEPLSADDAQSICYEQEAA